MNEPDTTFLTFSEVNSCDYYFVVCVDGDMEYELTTTLVENGTTIAAISGRFEGVDPPVGERILVHYRIHDEYASPSVNHVTITNLRETDDSYNASYAFDGSGSSHIGSMDNYTSPRPGRELRYVCQSQCTTGQSDNGDVKIKLRWTPLYYTLSPYIYSWEASNSEYSHLGAAAQHPGIGGDAYYWEKSFNQTTWTYVSSAQVYPDLVSWDSPQVNPYYVRVTVYASDGRTATTAPMLVYENP